jgi:hypothetical protein
VRERLGQWSGKLNKTDSVQVVAEVDNSQEPVVLVAAVVEILMVEMVVQQMQLVTAVVQAMELEAAAGARVVEMEPQYRVVQVDVHLLQEIVF